MNHKKRIVYNALNVHPSRRKDHQMSVQQEKLKKEYLREIESHYDKNPNLVKKPVHRYRGAHSTLPTYKVKKGDLASTRIIIDDGEWIEWKDWECVNTNPIEWKQIHCE